ncbi:MAG: Dabb family protein [Lachnospiraceae bacterium]|nr:Dabb family protein [Lachnospiraceae bacterium]
MVRHVIVWTLKDEYSDEEKRKIAAGIKEGLEGLKDKVSEIKEIRVNIEKLPGSTGDLMLDSLFEDFDALKAYSAHPAHVEVADGKVRPFVKIRSSFDYEV